MMDCVIQFRDVLQGAFGQLDWLPEPDGGIHRFHVPGDKAGTLNGWYVLYLDGIASGAFGSWKAGSAHTWCSREPLDAQEAEQVRQRVEQARRQREAEQHQRQQAQNQQAQPTLAASLLRTAAGCCAGHAAFMGGSRVILRHAVGVFFKSFVQNRWDAPPSV